MTPYCENGGGPSIPDSEEDLSASPRARLNLTGRERRCNAKLKFTTYRVIQRMAEIHQKVRGDAIHV